METNIFHHGAKCFPSYENYVIQKQYNWYRDLTLIILLFCYLFKFWTKIKSQ